MQDILMTMLQGILAIIIPIIAKYLVTWLRAKAEEARNAAKSSLATTCLSETADAVATAVLCVSQTYTDSLKKAGKFDANAQTAAFDMAMKKAGAMLSIDAAKYIQDEFGDISKYLAAKIEAEVKLKK